MDERDPNLNGIRNLTTRSEIDAALNERELQIRQDYEWCLHSREMQEAHGGSVVAIHKRQVWGAGQTHAEALEAAMRQPGCPRRDELTIVVVPDPAVQEKS